MSRIAITNVTIFDGSGADPYPGEVLVDGNRIVSLARQGEYLDTGDARIIDGHGAFLMPGMTEAHTHFSWNDQPSLSAIQFMPPRSTSCGVSGLPSVIWRWGGPVHWVPLPPSRAWMW